MSPLKGLRRLVIAATLLTAAASAQANTQAFTFLNANAFEVVTLDTFGPIIAGRYQGTLSNVAGNIFVYCTDVTHTFTASPPQYTTLVQLGLITDVAAPLVDENGGAPGPNYFYQTGVNATSQGGGLQSAFNAFDYQVNAGGPVATDQQRANVVGFLSDINLNNALTSAEHAATQVAIWDVIQDGGDGLGAGTVKMTGLGWSAAAQAYFNFLNAVVIPNGVNYQPSASEWIQQARSSDVPVNGRYPLVVPGQDMVYVPGGTIIIVPEFGTVAGLGGLLMMGGLAMVRTRRRRSA